MFTFHTEHIVKLPDDIEIYYTDSGAPDSADYTTLVILHGTSFNGDSFIPIHEYAHKTNLRTIVWNRRDYRGSTRYTDDELADLSAGRQIFQDRHAMQIAWFLEHFIETQNTPKLSADRKTGGFILAGWSFGNATTLSLFSGTDAIPKAVYERIEPYIMTLVLYDPPYGSLGYPSIDYDKAYNPFYDPDYTPEQRFDVFKYWVGGYFKHPDIDSGEPSGLDYSKRTECSTVDSWTVDQTERYIDKEATVRSELPSFAPPMEATFGIQTHKALFDEQIVARVFPNAHIFWITGDQTVWVCMWPYTEFLRRFKEAIARGEKVRQTSFRLVQGVNHFIHYDFPELFLQEVIKGSRREYET